VLTSLLDLDQRLWEDKVGGLELEVDKNLNNELNYSVLIGKLILNYVVNSQGLEP